MSDFSKGTGWTKEMWDEVLQAIEDELTGTGQTQTGKKQQPSESDKDTFTVTYHGSIF
jgi:hypothetical protein